MQAGERVVDQARRAAALDRDRASEVSGIEQQRRDGIRRRAGEDVAPRLLHGGIVELHAALSRQHDKRDRGRRAVPVDDAGVGA
jgi:hypothetical protein